MAAELKSPPTVDSLAIEFCDALRATLTPEQMEQVVSRNDAETHPGVCHSHDFCDANMVLHEVFVRHGMDVVDEGGMERWADLWNATWNLAKSRGFRMFKRGDRVEILKDFQDPGDEEFTWIVMDDEEKGRVDIQPVDIPMNIKPLYTVQVGWIKRA
jgi:aminoglycoside phosphotransferase